MSSGRMLLRSHITVGRMKCRRTMAGPWMMMELRGTTKHVTTRRKRERDSPQITSSFHGSGGQQGATGVLHRRSWGTLSQHSSKERVWPHTQDRKRPNLEQARIHQATRWSGDPAGVSRRTSPMGVVLRCSAKIGDPRSAPGGVGESRVRRH